MDVIETRFARALPSSFEGLQLYPLLDKIVHYLFTEKQKWRGAEKSMLENLVVQEYLVTRAQFQVMWSLIKNTCHSLLTQVHQKQVEQLDDKDLGSYLILEYFCRQGRKKQANELLHQLTPDVQQWVTDNME